MERPPTPEYPEFRTLEQAETPGAQCSLPQRKKLAASAWPAASAGLAASSVAMDEQETDCAAQALFDCYND